MGKGKKIFIILLLLLIAVSSIFYFKRSRQGKESVSESKRDSRTVDSKKDSPKTEKKEDTSKKDDGRSLSGFSSNSQSVGSKSEDTFVIKSIKNEDKGEYHEIIFVMEGKSEPFVEASYLSSSNSIRVKLNQIEKDLGGIAHQSSRNIDIKGVKKIYRGVSSIEDEEIYDIGVSSSTLFRLESKKVDGDIWNISLLVKYLGDLVSDSSKESNLGSKDFSKDSQIITGVGSDKNASVTSYTFSRSDNVLKFVWSVTANGDNPMPSVEGGYKDGKLVVEFADLISDRVSGVGSVDLSSSVKILTERVGKKSVYTFEGVAIDTEFRLSGSFAPNQVSLEIKL